MRFAEIHTTAADASDLKGLVTDLSTSRGCRAGRRPPSRRCRRPPCRWCRPLSSASASWSRGRRWRCSRPSRPTPTTGTRRRGTESRSPSLLCNIIIISVLHNITIRLCVLSPVSVMRVAPVEGFAFSPLAVVQTSFQIPSFAELRGAVVTICNTVRVSTPHSYHVTSY